MTKRILLSLILWGGVVFSSFAQNVTVGGIYYSYSTYTKKATVAYDATISAAYSGDIVIPSTFVYNDVTYTVTTIAGKAFQNSTALTSIVIPESIQLAGLNTYTFDGCSNLQSVTINTNNVTNIPNYFFQNCSSLTEITIPASVTSIGQYAFNGCTSLATVSILGNVTSVGTYAFSGCSSVTSIILPTTVTSIGSNAFNGCTNLASINIPSGVTSIAGAAFQNCSSLKSITIPSGVTTIGYNAFSGCTGLTNILVLASSPASASSGTFQYVLKSIPVYVPAGSKSSYQAASYWSSFTNFKEFAELTEHIDNYGTMVVEVDALLLTGDGAITIKNGGIVTSPNILGATPENLIIEDGGQLAVNSSGVQATFQKGIAGYTGHGNKGNYYLIANPTTTVINPTEVEGMLSNGYDLFYFDESQEREEWRNYKQDAFNLVNGKGYLYANSENFTLSFAGTVPTGTSANITLNKKGEGDYAGFNLVGNPMSVNIRSMEINSTGCSYYKLDPSDGMFVTGGDLEDEPIKVGEAFMVEADDDEATLNLNPGSKDESSFNNDVIRLEVSNNKYTDVAYLYFGNHLPLTKINHLNDEAPMLYIHNEKADQAVAVMNDRSEVKSVNVNFEAKTMGSYTISGKAEKGNFSYMHLYDRLTGSDTDLLISDYTFIGSNTDATGRFILRFEAIGNNSESESFAYQNGSDIIINGEGELQIFDVMGRMVSTQNVNGRETVNVSAQGVYIFRLNGMTQKIVVR